VSTDLEPVADTPPASSLIRQAGTTREISQAIAEYHDLCARVLEKSDFQRIGVRDFPKKSAWRKLAVAFNVSCSYLERNYHRDEDGNIVSAEVVARATAPNGRYMDGLGVCHRNERKYSKPEHDIPATAATRATNRACADLFGMGEVSAEEVTDDVVDVPAPKPLRKVRQAGPPGMGDPTIYVQPDTGEVVPDGSEKERQRLITEMFSLFKALDSNDERTGYDDYRTHAGISLTKKGRDYTLEEAEGCVKYLSSIVERPF
jgi:hypothetical protein